jgi:hypothetical protein
MQAAAARAQAARDRQLNRERLAEQHAADARRAQTQRRWLALAVFGTLGVVLAGVLFYRRRRRAAAPD